MKLHPITWILLGVAGVKLAAFCVLLAEAVAFFDTAQQAIDQALKPWLQAFVGQWLGSILQGLGGLVASAMLAVWVEVLSRIYQRLRIENARG